MFRKLSCVILFTALAAMPASIVAQHSVPNYSPTPNWDLYGGYSYVSSDFGAPRGTRTHGMSGWDVSLKVPLFSSWLGIKGDVSGIYNTDNSPDFNPHAYYFLFGPQVSVPLGRSRLWVHGLVGSANVSDNALPSLRSSNELAVAVGGGFDAGIGRHLAWRFAGDYYNTHWHQTSTTNSTVSEILNSNGRITTGPVLRF